jgi:NAD(P)-dependent dehydrogenase (short-subunit alcohol dehydrogenase family)
MEREAQGHTMDGRVCVVTGPTSGIGTEIARGLAAEGATVVLACRNSERGIAVRDALARETGNAHLSVAAIDLASLASIRDFARNFQREHDRLHVLVNNAGLYCRHRQVTTDGLEMQLMVNALGPFYLTNLLHDPLAAGAPSRVVNVASAAHRGGRVDFDDLQRVRSYSGFRAYTDSKFALVLLTYEQARRWQGTGITVNALHPGVIRTNLGRGEYPPGTGFFKLFFKGPKKGAETPLYVAMSAELNGSTGQYYSGKRAIRSDPGTYDTALAQRLWDQGAKLVGLAT